MVDYAELALLASSGFFAVLSFSLLYRYRQVSQQISDSTDMGRDLWQALEQRMRKQDERIIDLMARFDVVQSRVVAAQVQPPVPPSPQPPMAEPSNPVAPSDLVDVARSDIVTTRPVEDVESHQSQEQSQSGFAPPVSRDTSFKLDDTEIKAIQLLSSGDLDTRKITDALSKSREHTARVMKNLFEKGCVTRDDSKKPFVYRLTDLGRKRLPQA